MPDNRKTVLLAGGGNRGEGYARHCLRVNPPISVGAVADPDPVKRSQIAKLHRIPESRQYPTWQEFLAREPEYQKHYQGVIIATPDSDHRDAALSFLHGGVHVLLEKPIATTPDDLASIQTAWEASIQRGTGSLTVCHVLRHTALFSRIHTIIQSGILGTLVSLFQSENITNFHMAHSYVRGNWANSKSSSPIILAKTCHDLDLMCWFANARAVSGYCQGTLEFFTSENAPKESPEQCLDGCPHRKTCSYYAPSVYLEGRPIKDALKNYGSPISRILGRFITPFLYPWKHWPTSTITNKLNREGILSALSTGPYGRCVYRCNNDQPDHIEAVIRFQNNMSGTFRFHGHSAQEGRTLRIDGTRATLRAHFGSRSSIEVQPHDGDTPKRYTFSSDLYGHGSADKGLIQYFSRVLEGKENPVDLGDPFASHWLAFALEQSRLSGMPFGVQ